MHTLYQEDPYEYRSFLFKARSIRRLRIGGRGMASWVTAHPPVSLETRARQILRRRVTRSTRRFETLLQTTRRTPVEEAC
jgi:hypothetical protein